MTIIKEVDDTYMDIIGDRMSTIGEEYTRSDLDLVFSLEHKIIASFIDDKLSGFCVLIKPDNEYFLSYTWCDNSLNARKAFLKGIDYLIEHYPDIKFIKEREPVMYKAYLKRINKWQPEQQ